MKKSLDSYFSFTTHGIVALAISLIVNFSYLLSLIAYERDYSPPELRDANGEIAVTEVSGIIRLNVDGYGYLTACNSGDIDSIYVQPWRLRMFDVTDGDLVQAEAVPSSNGRGHYRLINVKSINGRDIDYGEIFGHPKYAAESLLQIVFYLLMSLLMIVVMTLRIRGSNISFGSFAKRMAVCLAFTVLFYFAAPVVERPMGVLRPLFLGRGGSMFDTIVIMKCSFSLVVSILYAFIYTLVYQRQSMVVENERLKSENLTTRYDMLVSQVNPHFFFNSLNSLATLVRENDNDKALTYIDTMSYTFRYILQNGQNMAVTLREELAFADAYGYLFKIRYADKIFFDIEVDESFKNRLLPSLSLQPLIDNAVKHNAVTSRNPMRITIRVENDRLCVSNPKYPLLEPATGTGTGLKNLSSRYMLITGRDIEITDTPDRFTVQLPLLKSENVNFKR
ncbi:MAG: histidine kinase [Alistipes sp.]|nr:histidine kinase [Alistipes sp.]